MNETVLRAVACVVTACLACFATMKGIGALQQSGYQNKSFLKWIKRKDNLFFNRLFVLSLCLALATTVVSLCFSYFGERTALSISAIPFFFLWLVFARADSRIALKVPLKRTGRVVRLFAVYFLFTASAAYVLAAFLGFLSDLNGSFVYALIAYAPFSVMPMLLPFLLIAANAVEGVFENARNKKFVKRAGQVLDETEIIRIGVVGSYGKTSVKNILKTLLSQRFSVVETPASYNTPIGIAKTVFSPEFNEKQILIAEMGARKSGDIAQLCALVKPDYAIFTGICEQHVQGFGSLDNVWAEKSEILRCGAKKVFCGAGLEERLSAEFAEQMGKSISLVYTDENADLGAAATSFVLDIYGEKVKAQTQLLGNAAVENIRLAASICTELGMTAEEIVQGIEKLTPIPHRLQLIENGGVYILDDGYNCSPKSAEEALAALARFSGRKCIVTPGIVECGILEEKINGDLGAKIAAAKFDKVILVGETLVGAVKKGYLDGGGDAETLSTVTTLDKAKEDLAAWLQSGDCVLFLNDLPDLY